MELVFYLGVAIKGILMKYMLDRADQRERAQERATNVRRKRP